MLDVALLLVDGLELPPHQLEEGLFVDDDDELLPQLEDGLLDDELLPQLEDGLLDDELPQLEDGLLDELLPQELPDERLEELLPQLELEEERPPELEELVVPDVNNKASMKLATTDLGGAFSVMFVLFCNSNNW